MGKLDEKKRKEKISIVEKRRSGLSENICRAGRKIANWQVGANRCAIQTLVDLADDGPLGKDAGGGPLAPAPPAAWNPTLRNQRVGW